jgi:hypothetical protein
MRVFLLFNSLHFIAFSVLFALFVSQNFNDSSWSSILRRIFHPFEFFLELTPFSYPEIRIKTQNFPP